MNPQATRGQLPSLAEEVQEIAPDWARNGMQAPARPLRAFEAAEAPAEQRRLRRERRQSELAASRRADAPCTRGYRPLVQAAARCTQTATHVLRLQPLATCA